MEKILYLGMGSLLGGYARYFASGAVYRAWGAAFPYGTLVVNVAGCFIIGLLYGLTESRFVISPQMRILLMTGFCGAFTTFSTFIFESFTLARDGEIWRAVSNIAISIILGFLAFLIANMIAKSI